MSDAMADDRDDTDELPSTSEVFRVPDHTPRPDRATTPLSSEPAAGAEPAVSPATPSIPRDAPLEPDAGRPARFAGSRRRALLWDAGWCLVTGVVLLVFASAGRPVEVGPNWATPVSGGLAVAWSAVLVTVAAGGVSRASTAVVGLLNLVVGGGACALGWVRSDVPTLLVVLAAQVAGFGMLQVIASLRR